MTKEFLHTLSLVIPVYKCEKDLEPLINEVVGLYGDSDAVHVSELGNRYSLREIILVHDNGPDESAAVMRQLQRRFKNIKCIWLSRNYGQHAATFAGMSETVGDWIVTLDEDGQQNPKYFPNFLDKAIASKSQIVYARAINKAPHGVLRNGLSRLAKWFSKFMLAGTSFENFNSYRLILGEPARALSEFGRTGIYLDAGLMWVTSSATTCDVELRSEDRSSGYSMASLLEHFVRLVVTAGARPLRVIAILGLLVAAGGFSLTGYIIWMKVVSGISASGWTSVIVAVLVTSGLTMLSLGVISEFLGATVRSTMGKPLFLKVSDPIKGPLGEDNNSSNKSASD
jgi:undecaprenyl-phosphate 4-deoxy-4-formamido-L-arabinose transferase